MSPAFSKLFMGVMVDLALIVKILATGYLLAADSSSICPNVVVCLFVVIKLENCLLTAC